MRKFLPLFSAFSLLISAWQAPPRPQDNLYLHVNNAWLEATPMPPDRVTQSTFTEITDRTEADLRAIIEQLAATSPASGTTARQIVDLYTSAADPKYADALGATPLRAELDRIEAIRTMRDVASEAGQLSKQAVGGPFEGSVGVHPLNPGRLVFRLTQGGNLLPDRDYYLNAAPAFVELRQKYERYLTTIFTLAARPDPAAGAKAVIAVETALARGEWAPTAAAPEPPARVLTLTRMAVEFPGFDWQAWARPQGVDQVQEILVAHPPYFAALSKLTQSTPIESWKAWLAARHITALAPFLSEPFVDARFEFFGRDLTGQEAPRAHWKRGVSLVNTYLGDAVGKLYAQQRFPAGAERRVEALVATIVTAFKDAIRASDWMSAAAKNESLAKLSALSIKIGAPSRWRDYDGLVVKPEDLLGNIQRGKMFDNAYRMQRVNVPVDRREWNTTPQTANAYYNPSQNEIVLPAAILQAPLYAADADDAANYGGIGAVIGHELAHAFDSRGRFVDSRGATRDWWTKQDVEGFSTRASGLVAQFNDYRPIDGMRVDGVRTFQENLGDLIGLSIAHRAYRLSLKGRPAPVLGGLTGDQRLFLNWARIWRTKIRDDYERHQIYSSTYAPARYRANGPASNLDAFYEAFGIKAGDEMYREPGMRVRIW